MVGRTEEKKILETCLSGSEAEFLALYGRRRVGKTYLIKEFFNNTFSFYATGVMQGNTRQQLRIFREALTSYGDEETTIPKDWFEAFSRLRKLLESESVFREHKHGRRVVFFDEVPWMDTPRSDFKSALDYFWNSWGSSQKDLLFIICGSATSWIINNIVKDTGGFYNRITKQIHLMPFTLHECELLLESNGMRMTRRQIVECYMVMGGIPYYLNYLDSGMSLAQNIDKLFFGESSPLHSEFTMLFSSLFNNADMYTSIIKEIYSRRAGVTRQELIDSGHTPKGKELSTALANLEQCGFIKKYQNFSKSKQGCIYQLVDPLCRFHLTFLEMDKIDSWMDYIDTPSYYSWCGLSFENVCLLHVNQIKQALGISGVSSRAIPWRSKIDKDGAQIDLLIDRKDDIINICEIKFTNDEFSVDAAYEKELIHKIETFRQETATKKALWLTMISFSGIKKNKYTNNIVSYLTGEDMFGE